MDRIGPKYHDRSRIVLRMPAAARGLAAYLVRLDMTSSILPCAIVHPSSFIDFSRDTPPSTRRECGGQKEQGADERGKERVDHTAPMRAAALSSTASFVCLMSHTS